jgi:hypothetical protein
MRRGQRCAIQWCQEGAVWAVRMNLSKQILGASYAALQCLSRIGWKAI